MAYPLLDLADGHFGPRPAPLRPPWRGPTSHKWLLMLEPSLCEDATLVVLPTACFPPTETRRGRRDGCHGVRGPSRVTLGLHRVGWLAARRTGAADRPGPPLIG